MTGTCTLRPATPDDIPALNALIATSARVLSAGYYSEPQIDAAIRYVFGVDTTLIADQSYFVAMDGERVIGCGGWSRRRTLYGGDQRRVGEPELLDPTQDAAKIRAFFVAPDSARRGVGTAILERCIAAAREAGFRQLELMATLPGVPMYEARGFVPTETVEDVLPDGTPITFVRMRRPVDGARTDGGNRP
ncbi:MAG: GNAT family N-acetyltransferase [Gemmatimonadaceae bacterium]